MPQKRISIWTSRSIGSRRGMVADVSPDVGLVAEYAFVLVYGFVPDSVDLLSGLSCVRGVRDSGRREP